MISNRLNLGIVLRLLIFAVTTAGLMYFLFIKPSILAAALTGAALLIETFQFIYYLNALNRKLTYIFDSIRNEDTSLKFPENVKNKSLLGLHRSFNNLNRMIADIKIKSETKEHFFKELIEHSSTGLMSIDSEGYIEVINQNAKKFLGVVQLAHIRLLQQLNPSLYEVIQTIKPGERIILKQIVKKSLVNLSIQSSELRFGKKLYRLVSLQDIRYELEEAEIDSWQKLIRVMTHEIMNSIAPITSLTNTLTRFFRSADQARKPGELTTEDIANTLSGLAVIEERGKGLMHFVENYRKLTKIPTPTFGQMDIHSWSESFELLFRSEFQKNNWQFRRHLDPNLTTLLTDEKLFDQILINLMTNAMDAIRNNTPDNPGRITLTITRSTAQTVLFELADNGPGIDESLMDKIFVPFFTTKEGGNGIGLSLSRQIARHLNGKLSVQSEKGKGCRFLLEI